MKTARIIVILFLAICLPFVADSTEDRTIRRNKPTGSSERRTALVIGNSNYASSPLKNPANDARDMAKTLEELGFDVIHRENAGKKAIREGIRDFEKKLRGGGVGLFYFAGHGMQVGGKNYLIPTDAQIETEADVEDAAVEANWILGKMEDAGNEINIVILDACRNNPVARSFRSASAGLAEMKAPKGAVIAYATSPGEVAADGYGKNGTYTKYLLKYLREPGLEIGQFFKKVGKDVADETGEKQMPWMDSKFYGDFYFLADSGSIATEKPQIPAEPAKPKQATLNITADVSGAEVWVNGNKQGVLPRNFTISESGMYEVEVTAPGYKKYRTSKNIEIGKEYEVAVHLEKEPEAPPAPVVKPSVSQKPSKEGFINSLGMKFVYIPPGTFMMGSPSDEPGRYDNETQHRVTISKPFYMQTTEITQAQWKAVMGSNPSKFTDCGDDCPVEQVSWDDVQGFIKKLNQKGEGTYRLPTEAEWEYAARAGTTTPFSFGNCLSADQANYDGKYPLEGCAKGQYRKKTVPVESFAPNAWGLYDMHGNVWEWCADWKGDYPSGSVTNPPSSGSAHVLRGGGWNRIARDCRAASRISFTPVNWYLLIGFRIASSSDQ